MFSAENQHCLFRTSPGPKTELAFHKKGVAWGGDGPSPSHHSHTHKLTCEYRSPGKGTSSSKHKFGSSSFRKNGTSHQHPHTISSPRKRPVIIRLPKFVHQSSPDLQTSSLPVILSSSTPRTWKTPVPPSSTQFASGCDQYCSWCVTSSRVDLRSAPAMTASKICLPTWASSAESTSSRSTTCDELPGPVDVKGGHGHHGHQGPE